MQNVLVTGGAGFVGSNLVKLLLEKYNCNVTVLDDLFSGSIENLARLGVANQIEMVVGSVLDEVLVSKVMRNKDTVFHLAAVNIIASMSDPRLDLQANVVGTFNVLDAAQKTGVGRLVYTSTSSVYGNSRYLPVCEDDGVRFLNFYSASKYGGESYAQVFYEQFNLPVTIVRYTNVYGYNQHPSNPYAGVIGKFIDWALRNQDLHIHGDGNQTRDFTFVIDACQATIQAALSPRAVGETYNIGTGVETSVSDLARLIIDITSSQSKLVYEDKRPIDNVRRRVLNVEKARSELRFTPTWTLQHGLKETIAWMSEQT